MFGGLIGAAAGLVGGFLDRKDRKDARRKADYNNSPQGIRDRAEAAGFNPLVFAGPGTGTGAQYAPTMGGSLATSLSLAAESFTDARRLELQKTELELEKQRLEKLVKDTTLTPRVPGVYGRVQESIQGNAGRSGGIGSGVSGPRVPAGIGGGDSLLGGVNPSDNVHGTVPYTGMFGTQIPGPNPDTQMGIDEVLGWGLMEGASAIYGGYSKLRDGYDGWRQGRKSRPPARSYTDPVPYHPIWGYASPRSISPTQAEMDQHRYRMNVLTGN